MEYTTADLKCELREVRRLWTTESGILKDWANGFPYQESFQKFMLSPFPINQQDSDFMVWNSFLIPLHKEEKMWWLMHEFPLWILDLRMIVHSSSECSRSQQSFGLVASFRVIKDLIASPPSSTFAHTLFQATVTIFFLFKSPIQIKKKLSISPFL